MKDDGPAATEADLGKLVERVLVELRKGPGKCDAYFELVEADDAVIPLLIAAFHRETGGGARALLVDAIWEHRNPVILEFLAEALADPEGPVWKNALDGFVALGTAPALARLRAARERLAGAGDADRLLWIDEAVQQIAEDVDPGGATPTDG